MAPDLPHPKDMFTMTTSIFVVVVERSGGVAVGLVEFFD